MSDTVTRAHTPPLLRATLGGLAVGVAGLLIQWVARPATFAGFGFPPGIVYVVAAGVIVWLDRRGPWAPVAAIGLALWIVVGGLVGGNLGANLASGDAGAVAGNLVMVLGLLGAAGTGIAAIVARRHEPRTAPLARTNPARAAVVVTIVAALAGALGDGAPEGFAWDGPGPVLFTLLAVLVAVVPGRSVLLLSALLAAAFTVTSFLVPDMLARLTTPAAGPAFWFALLQVGGYAVTLVAAVVAAVRTRPAAGR